MIFIFGGKYQGKKDFAINKLGKTEDDIFGPEEFRTLSPEDVARMLPDLKDKIVIMDDISQGLVPMDPEERAWREASGRMMMKFAEEADEVYRLFCGIPTRLK